MEIDHVPFCGSPNFDELKIFISENNININIEYLKKCFITNNIIIEEDDYIDVETVIENDNVTVKLQTHIEIHSNIEYNVKPVESDSKIEDEFKDYQPDSNIENNIKPIESDFNIEDKSNDDQPDSNIENNVKPIESDSNIDDDLIEIEIEVE